MKTCSTGAGALSCKMLALNATLPLYNYTAAFPIVITVLPGIVSVTLVSNLPHEHPSVIVVTSPFPIGML